ncbi:hypothetical protein KQX54_013475 [Cotesia glomerata]|uniref:DDE Tnp4 domain-containing protein n=1 Tax=Cotesia glomerata TaxID=32391 RepID=A0AAV7IZ14_COTGL|nr:hypothetical protein KQX54_013475 [Cotesia glomerata]
MDYTIIGIVLAGTVQNLLESSDDDSSDDEDLVYCFGNRDDQNIIPRIENYVETTVFRMTDETFKSHFRMRRDTFEFLINLLGPELQKQSVRYGRNPISVEKQLLLSIWTMSTPDSYRSVCDRFNVGKATGWRTLVCDHKLKFIHAYCGEAGSVHDARVFRLSNLQNYWTPEFFPNDSHLLGDKAYSIQPCVMVPYRNNDIPILVNHQIPPFDIDVEANNDMKIAGMEKREQLKNFLNNL